MQSCYIEEGEGNVRNCTSTGYRGTEKKCARTAIPPGWWRSASREDSPVTTIRRLTSSYTKYGEALDDEEDAAVVDIGRKASRDRRKEELGQRDASMD